MKTNTLKAAAAVGLSALLVGSAAAQESKSKPVGYETVGYTAGFNYVGIRLHEAPVASGASTTIDFATVTVADGVADALVAGTTYLFEATTGDAAGAVTTVESFDADADSVTLSDDLSDNFADGDEFIIRPASTLASIFGDANDVANSGGGLTSTGSFGTCDQAWVPDGQGGFSKYAYVQGNPFTGTLTGWKDADGADVTAADTALIYSDGVILVGAAAGDVVVSGSVKLQSVALSLTTTFNYAGSIFPAGLTLAESELENSLLSTGSFGTSDQLWLSDGAGGFAKYAFVQRNPFDPASVTGWKDADGNDVDGATVSFDDNSGVIVVRGDSTVRMVTVDSPDFYDEL